MPKRKRSDIEEIIENIDDRAIRIKASRLHAKVDHGNQILKKALDLARGFERQKLGRRQKQASSEPHTLLRLREEVIVLKELNTGKIANDYLFKQLAKTKRIKESAAFIALYGENPDIEAPKSNAEGNVLGRLFNSNPVKEALPDIMDSFKQVLNLDEMKPKVHSDPVSNPATKTPNSALEDDFEGFSDAPPVGAADPEAVDSEDSMDENAVRAYSNRLAGSDDSDDQSEDELDPMEISDDEGQDHDREELSPPSSASSHDEKPQPQPQPKQKPIPPSSKIESTSFLPSLSMSGYYSGSESGSDDFDPDSKRGPPVRKERNNRRGQRERQRIAELKFGKEAKHLQKQQKAGKEGRNVGWDAKRGAVDSAGYDSRQRKFGKGGFSRSRGPTGANGEAVVGGRGGKPNTFVKKDTGPLHPSWEAAKKKKKESGKVAFAGKKITFD